MNPERQSAHSKNSPRVREILSWYGADNPGVLTNLSRLMNTGELAGTGKMVILPVDQGFEHGPARSFAVNREAYDPHYHFRLAIESGCNAYAAPLGFLQAGAREFAGEIPLILKINNSDSLYSNSNPIPAVTASIDQALSLGCVGIGFTIYPGSGERKSMYEEIALASEQAKAAGLCVVIWSYARGEGLNKDAETALDVIAYAAHIAAQLGAHIIKVKPPTHHIGLKAAQSAYDKNPSGRDYSSLEERAKHVVESCFNGKRIVIFSGGEAKSKGEVLTEVAALARGGAFGSIMGRNAFQRPFSEAVDLLHSVMGEFKKS